MIIAVDYDGTLYSDGEMNHRLIERLRGEQRRGNIVILWTCRDGQRLGEAVQALAIAGFRPNLVNENAPSMIKQLGYNPRKILADVYIDDKAVRI